MVASTTQLIETFPQQEDRKDTIKLTFSWVSGTSGAGTTAVTTDHGEFLSERVTDVIKGRSLVRGEVIPGATTPTAAFDVVVNDENGSDLFGGNFADCVNSAPTRSFAYDSAVYGSVVMTGPIKPLVTNAGASKNGEIVLYFD